MKYISKIAVALTLMPLLCTAQEAKVTVKNSLDAHRSQLVEISISSLPPGEGSYAVIGPDGRKIASQITYDSLLVFPVSLGAKSQAEYRIQCTDAPSMVDTVACGRFYPDRDDDLAWENDLTAYRAYGPALQAKGQEGNGYDLFLKRSTSLPVLPDMYAGQLSGDNWRKVDSLKRAGLKDEAREFELSFTYHVDHGYGMDCYAVGHTLGAGTTAIVVDGEPVWPRCYQVGEILDNGPLRFTARLVFEPTVVDGDTIVEERIITLDAGSNLNRTSIRYHGASKMLMLNTGIAQRGKGPVIVDRYSPYMALVDPTQGTDNGELYIGAVFERLPLSAGIVSYGADNNHIAVTMPYRPDDTYTYYWGYGWNRGNIPSINDWNLYLSRFAAEIKNPLEVIVN